MYFHPNFNISKQFMHSRILTSLPLSCESLEVHLNWTCTGALVISFLSAHYLLDPVVNRVLMPDRATPSVLTPWASTVPQLAILHVPPTHAPSKTMLSIKPSGLRRGGRYGRPVAQYCLANTFWLSKPPINAPNQPDSSR